MDINCTSNCLHQIEGKCTLKKITVPFPEDKGKAYNDCAYYCSKNVE